eukprot:10627253-Alexandrium_andersonii.AAC.1
MSMPADSRGATIVPRRGRGRGAACGARCRQPGNWGVSVSPADSSVETSEIEIRTCLAALEARCAARAAEYSEGEMREHCL